MPAINKVKQKFNPTGLSKSKPEQKFNSPDSSKELETTPELEKFIQDMVDFFDKELVEETARETDFVQRESKLTGHLFLSVFTFGMSIYGTPTLEQLLEYICYSL